MWLHSGRARDGYLRRQVHTDQLFALERNDFEALPETSTVEGWLRSYAGCLSADAELMIEDYLRERDNCLEKLSGAVSEQSATESAADSRPDQRSPVGRMLALAAILAVLALGAWWMLSGNQQQALPTAETESASAPPRAPSQTAAPPEAEIRLPITTRTAPPTRTTAAVPEPEPQTAPAGLPRLAVREHGVGTGIENRQLLGRSDRFDEGAEVWFLTRVEGGRSGDTVRHVWLHQGVEKFDVVLRIGGSSWRTYSSKRLHPGSAGDWTVEARDDAGRVLASRSFACLP
jgi:hypothetical protein